jgi:tetratricopeptide (TPR) repeat protein
MPPYDMLGYKISSNPDLLDEVYGLTPEIKEMMEGYYYMVQKKRPKDAKKIIAAIKKYPHLPHLMNYLSSLYSNLGWQEKAEKVNELLIERHPNYLFALVNKANQLLIQKKYDEIPRYLGKHMELKDLFPERAEFHFQEFISFFHIKAKYLAAKREFEQAEKILEILIELGMDEFLIEDLESFINYHHNLHSFEENLISSIQEGLDELEGIPDTGQREMPVFEHEQIKKLYQFSFDIPEKDLAEILALPESSLKKDLMLVLEDSLDRFYHFVGLSDEMEEYDGSKFNFPVHALFILGEINAHDCLDRIVDLLSKPENYYAFYFGDLLTEELWEPVYKIMDGRVEQVADYMKKPGVYPFARIPLTRSFEYLAQSSPQKKEQIKEILEKVLSEKLREDFEPKGVDKLDIALFIDLVASLKLRTLSPKVKKLFDMERVDTTILVDYAEFNGILEDEEDYDMILSSGSLKEKYDLIMEKYH